VTILRNPDSHRFWSERYTNDPALGSGPGSAGEWKARKLDLLSQILRRHPIRRVVDLGCGDMQVLRDLPGLEKLEYIGIDFCAEVVLRNRERFPGLTFLQADLGQVDALELGTPDLVICFDVLFHIQDDATYKTLCSYLFNSGARALAFSCAVGRTDTNGVNLWYRDFWKDAEELGASYIRKVERPFRLPFERLVAVDLAEPIADQPTEVVYACSPDRQDELARSLGSLLRSGSAFDRAMVLWIGEEKPPRFPDSRIAVRPTAPLFRDYFFGNKILLGERRASRVVFLDADTLILRPLELLWAGKPCDFLARVGMAYEQAGWDRSAWAAAFAELGRDEIPMFNAGVLVFQNHAHLRIRQEWERCTRMYLEGRLQPPCGDRRMPEQWALSLALAGTGLSTGRLGPHEHCYGFADEPFEHAIVLHAGNQQLPRYAAALGPDAAPLAAAGAHDSATPAVASTVPPAHDELAARVALLEQELAALRASRKLALGRLTVAATRFTLALARFDRRRMREHWGDIQAARVALRRP